MPLVERPRRFLQEDIWRVRREALSPWRRMLVDALRVATIATDGFTKDLCSTRASALTLTSLLSLVPVLALSFAVLRGLGWHGARLETLILDKVTLLSPDAIATIVSYVDRVNFTGLGVVGGVFLLVTFVSVVTSVESAFNAIWDNVPSRTLGRRVTDYIGVMVVAPALLVLTTSLTAALQSNAAFLWVTRTWGLATVLERTLQLATWPIVWVLFTFVYLFVPNARVQLRPALIGALIAGTVWQATQGAYIRFQFGVAHYNAVYGALAQLPLLLAWLYASWIVVLFGAEIAHAVQFLPIYGRERRTAMGLGQAFREWATLAVAVELARAGLERTEPPNAERLAQLFDVPLRTIRDVLAALERAGLAHSTTDARCFLSVPPEVLSVVRVLAAVRGTVAPRNVHAAPSEAARGAYAVLEEMDAEASRAFSRRTLRDVVLSLSPPARVVAVSAAERPEPMERDGCGKDRRDPPKERA